MSWAIIKLNIPIEPNWTIKLDELNKQIGVISTNRVVRLDKSTETDHVINKNLTNYLYGIFFLCSIKSILFSYTYSQTYSILPTKAFLFQLSPSTNTKPTRMAGVTKGFT